MVAGPPLDSATVLLLRDRPTSGFEVFMLRRHAKSGFMGGAYVFPGGKLDRSDCEPALAGRVHGFGECAGVRLGENVDEDTARGLFVAAARETLEEAGVLIGTGLGAEEVRALRARLVGGATLAEEFASLDLRLDLTDVVPFARWITPTQEPKRFDTRFFLAIAPTDQTPEHDAHETTDQAWWSPTEALEAAARGEIQLPPPTARNLMLLEHAQSSRAVLDAARAASPPLVEPVIVVDAGNLTIALPGDPLHPSDKRVLEGPTRMVLEDGRWWAR